MPNTKEKLIESLERSLIHDGTGREMRFVGMDKPIIPINPYRWIPVTERLPKGCNGEDLSENVIAYLNNGELTEVCTGWCNGDQWWLIVGDRDTHTSWGMGAVTHWMPLPEPPKGE